MNDFDSAMLDMYFQSANERHRIYLKRQSNQPWPWTTDEIFSTYKFTNVYRQLDAGTLWLTDNWIKPYADHPMLFFNICFYRQFNWIPTAEYVGFLETWNADAVYKELKAWRDDVKPKPRQIYTNAHMVRGPIEQDGTREKLRYTVYNVLDNLYTNMPAYMPNGGNLQSAFNKLVKAYGFGGFVAYEVISDLRWTRYLANANDVMTWANAGPGCIRGLNRLLNREVKSSIPQKDAVNYLRSLVELSKLYLGDHMLAWEMREAEHWCCEFSKYMKVVDGTGRPRVKFVPPHNR